MLTFGLFFFSFLGDDKDDTGKRGIAVNGLLIIKIILIVVMQCIVYILK